MAVVFASHICTLPLAPGTASSVTLNVLSVPQNLIHRVDQISHLGAVLKQSLFSGSSHGSRGNLAYLARSMPSNIRNALVK